eukprot:6177951-Pleurochrysis_carterae.AAC.1
MDDEHDLAVLRESILDVFVDADIVAKLIQHPIVIKDIWWRECDYFNRAFLFFGKTLQLHMLAEVSHIPQQNGLLLHRLSGFADLDRIFMDLTIQDIEEYVKDEETKQTSLFVTEREMDPKRLMLFVQTHMRPRMP